ncbi:MAG: hypothetical protein WEE50_03130 [Chloroflexota bacterium]
MDPIETTNQDRPHAVPESAVAWINGRQAIVATMARDGQIFTCEINRGLSPEPSYLALVVHALGDRERVVILGPSSARLALEREYVAIYHRPDRLVDVEPAGAVNTEDLVARLRALAA